MKTHIPDDERADDAEPARSRVEVKGVASVDVEQGAREGSVRVRADVRPGLAIGGVLGRLIGDKPLALDVDVPVPGGAAGRALAGGLATFGSSLLADALRRRAPRKPER